MSIIKEKILLSGFDLNLNIKLSSNNKLNGLQQEINSFTKIKSADQINGITDGEVKRYSLLSSNQTINFGFYGGSFHAPRFTIAGFTIDEIQSLSKKYTNSFFILDFFNSFSTTQQTKLFSTYLTKLDSHNENNNPNNSTYEFDNSFQWYYLNIPINFTENYNDYITGYSRFSFYDAKEGKIRVFYNYDNDSLTTPEKMYVKTRINLNTKRWWFVDSIFNTTLIDVNLRELSNSQQYVNRYNETFENFDNLQPNYPLGTTFNYSGGTYF